MFFYDLPTNTLMNVFSMPQGTNIAKMVSHDDKVLAGLRNGHTGLLEFHVCDHTTKELAFPLFAIRYNKSENVLPDISSSSNRTVMANRMHNAEHTKQVDRTNEVNFDICVHDYAAAVLIYKAKHVGICEKICISDTGDNIAWISLSRKAGRVSQNIYVQNLGTNECFEIECSSEPSFRRNIQFINDKKLVITSERKTEVVVVLP